MTLLAIDPGKNIGWALFSLANGEEIGRSVMDFDLFSHSLNYRPRVSTDKLVFTPRKAVTARSEYLVKEIVYESWYLDPDIPQGGSVGNASEVIGVLKYLANQAGIPIHSQRSAILPVAMKHTGFRKPLTKTGKEKHLPDEDSAYLHGMYRLISTGVATPPHQPPL